METHTDGRQGVMGKLRGTLSLLTPALLVFMAGMILANIAGSMNGSLMPLYVQSLGADTKQIGLFFTVSAIAPLVLQIVGGFVSDSIGRLKAVAIGSIAGSIGYLFYAVAPSWSWLLVGHAVASLAGCFVAPSFQAFIAEQSTEETRARVFAVSESAFAVVGIVGPPIGGFLSQRYGFRLMFIAAGALYLVATVIRMAMALRSRSQSSSTYHAPRKMTLSALRSNMGAMVALVLAGGVMTWLFLSDSINDIAFSVANHFDPIYQSNVIGMSNIGEAYQATAIINANALADAYRGTYQAVLRFSVISHPDGAIIWQGDTTLTVEVPYGAEWEEYEPPVPASSTASQPVSSKPSVPSTVSAPSKPKPPSQSSAVSQGQPGQPPYMGTMAVKYGLPAAALIVLLLFVVIRVTGRLRNRKNSG